MISHLRRSNEDDPIFTAEQHWKFARGMYRLTIDLLESICDSRDPTLREHPIIVDFERRMEALTHEFRSNS